jgi:hypothetical protein
LWHSVSTKRRSLFSSNFGARCNVVACFLQDKMVLWGDLCPIPAQVVVDVLGFLGFGYATATKDTLSNA